MASRARDTDNTIEKWKREDWVDQRQADLQAMHPTTIGRARVVYDPVSGESKEVYRPAQNSAHLSGSSLDLLPPPGKSMSWLRQEVRKFHPDAQMLDEGDHLHTTFPGYYGAPAVGGARSAGLKNPLQGMPPPPPGFVLD